VVRYQPADEQFARRLAKQQAEQPKTKKPATFKSALRDMQHTCEALLKLDEVPDNGIVMLEASWSVLARLIKEHVEAQHPRKK
jgi:hypothetical protein